MNNNSFKKYLALTKVLLKNGTDTSEKGKKKRIGIFILLAVCFAPTISMLCYGLSKLYDGLAAVNQQQLILGLTASANCAIIFFFGLFYVLSFFYFTKDTDVLMGFPLSPETILSSRFTTVLVYEYLIELFTLAPFLVTYGYKSKAGIVFYLIVLVVFLVLPVIPLCLDAFIDMIIMRFTTFAKNKDRFRTVAGLLALFLGLGINFYMQSMGKNGNTENLQNTLLKGNNTAINVSSKLFPTASIAANGLNNADKMSGIGYLLVFLGISVAAFIIFIILGKILYFKGAMGISESTSSGKALSQGEIVKSSEGRSALISYTIKELKILFRTPTYFLNCVIMNFLWPLIVLIPFLSDKNIMKSMDKISVIYKSPRISAIVFAAGVAVFMFIGVSNCITSTAISREGKDLYFMKFIPVSFKTQIMAKVLSALTLSYLGMLIVAVIAEVLFKVPIVLLLSIIIVGAIGIVFVSFTGIIIDIHLPKLNWDNEQKAVKQNMNTLFNMLVAMVVGGLLVFLVVKLNFEFTLALILLFGVLLVLSVLTYFICMNSLEKIFKKL